LQFLLENGKKAPFDIKSPVKNFPGQAKGGGHRTMPPSLNTPLLTDAPVLRLAVNNFCHYFLHVFGDTL